MCSAMGEVWHRFSDICVFIELFNISVAGI